MDASKNLREEVPPKIVKWANLKSTMNELLDIFAAWREKNAELINNFLDQPYFKWEESLIDKLAEIKPTITFDEIGDEGINLATAAYNKKIFRQLKDSFDQTNDEIKRRFISEIFNKVQAEIWPLAPYNNFATECPINPRDNIISYLDKVVNYLTQQESKTNWRKAIEILKEITITNNDLNWWLIAPIAPWTLLTALPDDIKNSFDHLLSFEIGKEADRTLNIVNNITDKLWWLVSNSFPAINTIVAEHPEYRYEESKLWPDFETRKQAIEIDKNLTKFEKKEKIKDLKRELYIKYLKTKNSNIGNAIEQLYNNNFDYSKIDQNTLKDYMDTVINFRIRDLVDAWAHTILKLNYINMDDFSAFCKELASVDPSNPIDTTIRLTNVNPTNTRTRNYIDLPIRKTIVRWENPQLKDIDQYWWSAKSFDTVPFCYEIKQSDIDNLDINLEDRTTLLNYLSKFKKEDNKYVIEWKDVWRLIYLFFAINNKPRITEFNPDKQKELEKVFWKVKPSEKKEKLNDSGKFKQDIEKMWTWVKFEDWSEIWMPMWDSILPWWGYQWMKIRISDVDMKKWTFKGKVSWWELKFANNLEWKTRTFDMNDETISEFRNLSKNPSKIRLLPNPQKTDFNSFKNSLQNKLWTSELKFPAWITWDWNKFTQKIIDPQWKEKIEEVKYFSTKWDNESVYKIEYNPIRSSFKVSSTFNWKEKLKNWKSEDKRFSYSRDMDWNNFLIFLTQKWLTPQTEEWANDIVDRSEQKLRMVNGNHRKINWFSINNVKNVVKALKWNIKKKIDEYNKAQDEKLEDILIWDRWLYRKLAWTLGFIPSMKEWLSELEQEYYNERDNRTWAKIEHYLKKFQKDPDFWTTFDQVPPHAKIQWWESLQQIVLKRVANAKDRMWDPGIYQAAALLLANFEKWWSPYRGLADQENSWLWVKALLWKAHYAQFMRDKAKLIKARDEAENWWPWDKKWLNETLAACEMKYIINNIRWSYKWLIVWSNEERWIPWKDNTNYIDNPAKRLLSDQFANKLESAYQWRFNKDSVNEKYSKFKKNNSFDEIENEFGKASSTRYQVWQAALRRMIDLATTDSLKKRMKMHFLTYLLSGALDVNCDPWLKKQIYERAKPMWFVPWLLVKESYVAENVATLLDAATDWDFSNNITKYFRRNKQLNGWTDFKWLQNEIKEWFQVDEKGNIKNDILVKKLDNYFSKLPTKELWSYTEPKRSILKKYQNAMSDSKRDEGDRWILDNPKVVSNWLLSSVEVVEKRMKIKNWKFDGKDIDEDNNMVEFRNNVTEDIKLRNPEDPREVAFVLEKFINRFWIDNQQIYTWIKTADYWEKKQGYFPWPYEGVDLNMWIIWKKEINSILWYAFQWNAWRFHKLWCDRLPDELYNTLVRFREFFTEAYHKKTLLNNYVVDNGFKPKNKDIDPLFIWSRDVYDQIFAWDWDSQYIIDTSSATPDDDLYSSDPEKKKKAKEKTRKALLKSSDFINSDIANIEKKLKNNLSWTGMPEGSKVTSSRLETARAIYFGND